MFGSNILEICIGLILVFLIVAVICTAIREGLESWLKTRSAYLERGIRMLVGDLSGTGLAKSIYNHPLIYGLYWGEYQSGDQGDEPPIFANGGNLPAYIPTKNFVMALMDIVARGPNPDAGAASQGPIISLTQLEARINEIDNPQVRRVLIAAMYSAQGDINRLQKYLEEWYDGSMDRISGWYKRSTQKIIFLIAITASIGLNINAIRMANYLAQNDAARKVIVESAGIAAKDSAIQKLSYGEAKSQLSTLNLPIGWENGIESAYIQSATDDGYWNTLTGPLLGWLITALAATLGAPFWFDMLNKIIVIRSTVKPDEKSAEEASKDSRPKSQTIILPPTESGTGGTT